MRGNFNFRYKDQEEVHGAICNPFMGGYIIIGTGKVLKPLEMEELIEKGEIIVKK